MSTAGDLLEQARLLAKKERRRPLQASLRRSVSTAYYALSHFLGEESARLLFGSTLADRPFRDFARRAIAHTKLKDVCGEFVKPTPKAAVLKAFWTSATGNDPLQIIGDNDFQPIESVLRSLQELRHEADYNFSKTFNRQQALDSYDKAEAAMKAWRNLKTTKPDALKLFSMAILLWPGLSGRG